MILLGLNMTSEIKDDTMSKLIRLNIGCGRRMKKGYVNIDIRKTRPEVVVADIRRLPYPENSVDEIFANDSYEHISWAESQSLLIHWISKLKSGGVLDMQMPNILGLMKLINKQTEPKGIEMAIRKIFGGQDYKFNYHYTSGHPVLIKHYLRKAGIKGKIDITSKGCNMKVYAIK